MGLPPPNSLTGGITYAPGGGEIGFTDFQMNYITSLSFKLMGPLKDVHHYKWRDLIGPFGCVDHHMTLFSEYSIIPSAPASISFGIKSLTTLESTTVSTDTQSEL